jgi:glycosyltransferase involved in cell wall biosynthesis
MTNPRSRPIVQVVPYFRPHIGGMETVAQIIADGLAQEEPVEVLTSRSSHAPTVERTGNLVVRRLFTIEFAHTPFLPTLLIHLLRLPRRAVVHVHIAQAYVPEMVWLSSMLLQRPYVAHFHLDVDPSGRFGPVFVAYKRVLLGRVLRSAARVIAVSRDQPDFLMQRYGVSKDRIVLIPNGVGAQFFQETRAAPLADRPFRLLFVGRLSPQKNVSLLLNALAAVTRSVELVIVGDGEERPMLERLSAELGLRNVRMVGAKVGEDLVGWYRWADAFVLTSLKESTGLVLLEAMAARLPIIATNVVGVMDTVGDDGLLVAEEPAAFANSVDRLVSDPRLWAELSERSAKRAEGHLWPGAFEALKETYQTVFP